MDRLPIVLLERLLSFQDIHPLFTNQRVSRSWRQVCQWILKMQVRCVAVVTRDELSEWKRDRYPSAELLLLPVSLERQEEMARSLSVMENLKFLHLTVRLTKPEMFDELIIKNQETLMELTCVRLPDGVERMPEMSWLKLSEDLSDTQAAAVCGPSLTHLLLWNQSSGAFLRILSFSPILEQMVSISWRLGGSISLRHLVSAVSRMTTLQHIRLLITCDFAAAAVQQLFKCRWKLLSCFDIELDGVIEDAVSVDEELATLVQLNPQLEFVSIINLRVTTAGLDFLSRLPQLEGMILQPSSAETEDQLITTDAVLRFLRGSSRHSLRDLTISINGYMGVQPRFDAAALEGEVALMSRERGTHLRVEADGESTSAFFRIIPPVTRYLL